MTKVKVEVGQVWTNGSVSLTGSRIANGMAYYITSDGNEDDMGDLDQDGYTNDWASNWYVAKEAPATAVQNQSPSDLLSFFKAVPDGYCPCNISREKCDYHK